MPADRFVVLGLAGVRAAWFAEVARWATSATIPVDFVKVVSREEARARLLSGRAFSALLVDAGLGALDRDLVDLAAAHGCAVLAADDGRAAVRVDDLGVHDVLPVGFGPDALVDALTAVARPIARGDDLVAPTGPGATVEAAGGEWRGRLVAVTGAGGVGRSTLAAALATGLAADPRDRGLVVLADLALHAQQALLHDAGDVVPGVLELVEAHRTGALPPHEVRALAFRVADRGYDLLLGLRRHRDWTALRPRAVAAAVDATVRAYRHVVADVDADVEGERQCGSSDVEDRNVLARQVLPVADLVLVVGVPGVGGLHAQLRVLADLVEHGVEPGRVLPVVNRAPRSPAQRAEAGRALAQLLAAAVPGAVLAGSPVFVPERRRLADITRDSAPPPPPLVKPVAGAVRGLLDRARHVAAAPASPSTPEPVLVAPGSLGSWADPEGGRVTGAASPLAEIERAVQARAKDISLEMAAAGGEAKLRALIVEEVARWNDDHRRGRRAFALPDPDLVVERAFRNIARYGPLSALLADDDVWEIMVNAPDAVFVRRHRGPSGYHDEVFHDDDHVLRTLTKLLDDASTAHRSLDPSEGLQDAQLDDGARVHVVHGDIARGGHVLVNIRKFTGIRFRTLGELVDRDMLTDQVARFLAACVRARLSVVFAGPPGSGKTTLLSCTTAELDPALRVVVAEEVFESDIPVPNVAQMQTRAARADRPGVDLRRLVAGFLRMAPDVAVVGEVRDREALPLLLTLSSGVTGYTTIHAGSARQALTRLRFICQLADTSGGLPLTALNSLVSESIDVVVQCARTAAGPRVTEVAMVEDLAGGVDATHFTVTEVFRRPGPDQPLAWTGDLPARAARPLADAGFDVRRLLEGRGAA